MNFLRHLRGGYVITDLVVWDFSKDEEIACHIAEQVAKAIIMSYNMGNFGPDSFNFNQSENEE
jgi:hypothetical protein